jgi:homoserine O-succinyltransferase/O-acetyltransferase
MIRVAILDLYEGEPNQGMRCLRELLMKWSEDSQLAVKWDEFDVRLKCEVPDLSYDIYISSGGPGSPLASEGSAWEDAYFSWLAQVENWNHSEALPKKFVFFICHSFQLVSRHYAVGEISKRRSTAFGIFPVHVLVEGQIDPIFRGLGDPFYVVDSRDWQLTKPDFKKIREMGAAVLAIEKYRPHVPLDQAIMGIRFNEYMIGTQFHPEADAEGMSIHLQSEEKKKTVIVNYGEEKWRSMIEGLNDPGKIRNTYAHVIPNFLNLAADHIKHVRVTV